MNKETRAILQETCKAIQEVTFMHRGDALRMAALAERIEELLNEDAQSNQQGR